MPTDPQGLDQVLNGAVVLGPCDAWAVGAAGGSTVVNQPLIEHFDGHAWTVIPSPDGGQINELFGVGASSETSAWMVGAADGQTLAINCC